MEDEFARDVETAMKKHRYTTKTEFIREAIRNRLKDLETEEALARARKLYGAGKGKHRTTNKMLHDAREKAVKEIEKELETKEYV